MKRREAYQARRDVLGVTEEAWNAWTASPAVVAFLDEEADEGNPLKPETRDGVLHLNLLAPIFDGKYGTVGPQNFIDALAGHEGDVQMVVNSPGGSVFAGWTIRNTLARHEGKVTALIDGLAGSIATVVALAADERYMSKGSRFMVHQASGITLGTAEDHDKQAEVLRGMDADMAEAYADAGRGSAEHYAELMNNETWLTVNQAVKEGFVKREPQALFDTAKTRATIRADQTIPSTGDVAMTDAEKAEFESAKRELAEAKAELAKLKAEAQAQPTALFTSAVDGKTYTDQDDAELVRVAKREHEAKVESVVTGYPAGLQAAARALVEAGKTDELKSLDAAKSVAAASTATLSDPKAVDESQDFDAKVKAHMAAKGVSKQVAEIQVAALHPELL